MPSGGVRLSFVRHRLSRDFGNEPRTRRSGLARSLLTSLVVRRSGSKSPQVAIVADNERTLGDLQAYFERVGLASTGSREILDVLPVPSSVDVLVLFPDGYDATQVDELVSTTRRSRSKLFIILVTSAPQSFARSTQPDGQTMTPVVLSRPAFGWTIVDVIRTGTSPSPGA